MNRLLLYNPENDLALASGLEHFTPPSAAVEMSTAGAFLPFWWAEPGDTVLVPEHLSSQAESYRQRFNLNGRIGSSASVAEPWGWSLSTRRRLLNAGFPADRLPSAEQIDKIRHLSHRRITAEIHRLLGSDAIPVEARTTDEALRAIADFGHAVVKLPWSCSGRGVFFSRLCRPDELRRRIDGSIRRQGCVMIEPEYQVEREIAALFRCDDGIARFRGFSSTVSAGAGRYRGNLVMKRDDLANLAGRDALDAATALQPIISTLIGHNYSGWLGIDMLRHSSGLNPCMEVNLRMTMGVLALYLAERLIADGESGIIRTTPDIVPDGAIDLSTPGSKMKITFSKTP